MYGNDTGTLRVLVKKDNTYIIVWSKVGDKGDEWHGAQVNLNSTTNYQVIFEAMIDPSRGNNDMGDISIDDVKLTNDSCKPFSYNCTFDEHLCYWNLLKDKSDNFEWTRSSGATHDTGTGPSVDHTTGTVYGYYMYIEATYQSMNDTARMVSPLLPATNITCLSFWYHMYGSDINTLRILVKKSGRSETTLWSRNGPSEDKWQQGRANITSSEKYEIIVEGVRGASWSSDIAIDDIFLTDGECSLPTTTAQPATTVEESSSLQPSTTTLEPTTRTLPRRRIPSKKEMKQSALLRLKNVREEQWNTTVETKFRRTVAEMTDAYCKREKVTCGILSVRRKRRLIDEPIYNETHVHIVPGYPKQNGSDLMVAFYVLNPSGAYSPVLPISVLVQITINGKTNISRAIGFNLDSIEKLVKEPLMITTKSPTTSTSNAWPELAFVAIGCIMCVLLLVLAIFIFWRFCCRKKKNYKADQNDGVHPKNYQNEGFDMSNMGSNCTRF